MTITQAIESHLRELEVARSYETVRAYKNGLNCFCDFLQEEGLDPAQKQPVILHEEHIRRFLIYMKGRGLAASSRQLYLSGLKSFLEYLTWEKLAHIDLRQTMRYAKKLVPQTGYRLPQFPKDDIEKVIAYALDMPAHPPAEERQPREQGQASAAEGRPRKKAASKETA